MQTPVKELMSHPIISLSSQATIADALGLKDELGLLHERKISRISIVD